ncbi:paired immunoglobulin-like type 2 receptor alpha isoform X2 [Carettochelys insculpta]|uniref:paired immunoglobulin-like type 2 receptor alpha isoform X2 n=1 Tax=Carettochelys insculpta TaxID=44489 RepID=UPI003EB75205
MQPPLGRPVLLLLAGILGGATAQDGFYKLEQPESLRAPAGGSVTLPCRLIYPPEIEPLKDIRVYWRRGGFHGRFVYNHTERFTHPGYRGRITLVGDPHGKPTRTASIRIDRLQESDTEEYTCQVFVWSRDNDEITWRALPGTRLTVTAQTSTGTATQTQASTPPTALSPARLGAVPAIAGALAGAVLLALLVGLAVYGARRRTGCCQKAPPPRRGQSQKEDPAGGVYLEIGAGGPAAPPDPRDAGLLYTELAFPKAGAAPSQPVPPASETLYSAVRVC